ncbi:MAG: M1 family metallopeptidase [Chloroflexia bacterium]
MNPENPKAYRLPTHAFPRRYDIEIDARLGREDFHGKVVIKLDIVEARDVIELHAKDMKLSDARLTSSDGKTLEPRISQDNEREMAAFKFDRPLPSGPASLEVSFDGKVSKNMEGLYHAKDGPEECLCTQCEETDARLIFPCFDEPAFKAQFAWTVTTAANHTVLANGPLVTTRTSEDGASKTWAFEATKPMSSYLVALVIGDIAGTEKEDVNGTPISVWAMRGKEHLGEFAHRYTTRVLPWYEHYFGAPYHFDKYDQAAVPGFAAGAMENSGLVIYRQSALLMNPQTASWYQEKRIAHVIAHETAHMWFGNMVTMKWWDDIWLNEAFAEWIAIKTVDNLNPDYNIWNDFQGAKAGALANDALESTHAIYSPVQTPAEATEMFDTISYQKGCSVLRMLENFLGEEPFREGIRSYIREFTESNAAGPDLWRHLQAASSQPVGDIMESWIKQPGYPMVSVSVRQAEQSVQLQFSQKRFYSTPKASGGSDQLWKVPIVLRYEDDAGKHEKRYLMSGREAMFNLSVQGQLRWCYCNADEIGFYRQSLDNNLLDRALANLDKLTPLEQMGLLGDQWALVRNGSQRMSKFLDVLSAMTSIRNYSLLQRVDLYLHSLEELLEDLAAEEGEEGKKALATFRRWVDRSFKEQLDALGYEAREGESRNDTQSRVPVLDALAAVAHSQVAVERSVEYADREAADPASVDPNLASLFVSIGAMFGDRARMDKYVETYERRRDASASPQETNRYLDSLTEFRPPELVEHVLELVDEKIIPQEAIGPTLQQMLGQRHTRLQAWEYTKKHWSEIRTTLGDMWTGRLVEGTGNLPADKREDMVQFFDKNLNGVAEMSYARALETQDQLTEFKKRTRADLLAWFSKQ